MFLTRAQVREIDRRASDDYRIPGIVLMENASRAVAETAQRRLTSSGGRRALILCGGGNNGGDGLAAARHLHNDGFDVSIGLCADPARYAGDALANWEIVKAMKLPTFTASEKSIGAFRCDLIIDAIFGVGLAKPPRDPFPDLAQAVMGRKIDILAVDLPSGLDCDTGEPLGVVIQATETVTFAALKAGMANPLAMRYTGRISVASIGCPRELIEELAAANP